MTNTLTNPKVSAPAPQTHTDHRLGQRLVDKGHITPQQLQQALNVQSRSKTFLGQTLVDLGFVSASIVGSLLAQEFGLMYVDLLTFRPDPQAISLLPENIVRSSQALPLRLSDGLLEVAMVDPLDVGAIDTIHAVTKQRVLPRLTMSWELQRAINDHFAAYTRANAALQELETQGEDAARDQSARVEVSAASEAPIVRLVDSLIEGALALRASDIHFEPQENVMRIRYRVDGVLLEQTEIPRAQIASVIARIKVLCVMDITENRRPQDGRMSVNNHGRLYDIRVSSVPTVNGEKLVLRVLDKSSVLVPLAKLGFLAEPQKRFEGLIRQPHGMVIVVGPTGSGKSTTLYSALNMLNDSTRNIMTLEDPVEYNVTGINQIQVNARIGLTFASGLRTFVRQDPDVILVGEIRDQETAEMAIQASLTGHLVLSTLHTNSAVGTMSRLTNLGVDPFLIAQSVVGVVSQRLIARLCTHCIADYAPTPEVLEAVGIRQEEARGIRFKHSTGCRTCHGRGYLGRMGIYEVLPLDEGIGRLIMRGASEAELQQAAESNGMQSLRQAAMIAVRAGLTSVEEMGRVVLAKEAK